MLIYSRDDLSFIEVTVAPVRENRCSDDKHLFPLHELLKNQVRILVFMYLADF